MSRRKGIMTEALKYEIANELGIAPGLGSLSVQGDYNFETASELGVYNAASQPVDWGSVSSRDCGNMVKMAIQMAQRNLS